MLKALKMKIARKFYDVPATAYLSNDDVNDACICTALMYVAGAGVALVVAGQAIMGVAMIAQAFAR